MRLIISLGFVVNFFWGCNSNTHKLKLIPVSMSIDGSLGNSLKISNKKTYSVVVDENSMSYQIKVVLQSSGSIPTKNTEDLYLDLLDSEGNPISEFSKFKGPNRNDEELKALLNGSKSEMSATFTLIGIGFVDVLEEIESMANGSNLKNSKREKIRQLNHALIQSGVKKFKVSSF